MRNDEAVLSLEAAEDAYIQNLDKVRDQVRELDGMVEGGQEQRHAVRELSKQVASTAAWAHEIDRLMRKTRG